MTDKKIQLLEAAIRLFAEDGVGVPTSKIAKEAGVSNGTLFNYFETKQSLIDEVYFYIKQNIASTLTKDIHAEMDVEEMLRLIWHVYIDWALTHDRSHKVVELLKSSQVLSSEVLKESESLLLAAFEVLERGIEAKRVIDVPMPLFCEIVGAQMDATIRYILNNDTLSEDVQHAIEMSFQAHWHGLSE